MKQRKGAGGPPEPPLPADESTLFREAVNDARPLPHHDKVTHPARRIKPIPKQTLLDQQQVLVDSLSDHILWQEDIESGEELSFLRPGLPRLTLRKLRRGQWVVQAQLDLHGMTSDEARTNLVAFLNSCKKQGHRCIRIIHGKGLGSKNREPVLKNKVRNWLMQRDEILAFTQARQVDGGGGAVVVLLKAGN